MDKDYLKKLHLNRTNIREAIIKYYEEQNEEVNVGELEPKGGTRHRINIGKKEYVFYIDFHFNNDGTTTLDCSGGQNVSDKEKVCLYIKQYCQISDKNADHWFVLDGVTQNDFNASIEVVQESNYYGDILKQPVEKEGMQVYQFRGSYGEKVTVTRYATGKVVIQGKHLMLFEDIIGIMSNLVDYEDIPKLLNTNYKVSINKDDIIEETKIIMQDSFDKIWTEKLRKSILQAVYNMNLDSDMFEYTMLVFPAYRALEGHLRYVLNNNGIVMKSTEFHLFENDGTLLKEYKDKIHDYHNNSQHEIKVIKYLEETYKYFADNRHIYFHWNKPNPTGLDQTNLVRDRAHAVTLIRETLEYINTYFK